MSRGKRPFLIVAALIVLLIAPVALLKYLNYSAERNAEAFCGNIQLGSNISVAIQAAHAKKIRGLNFANPLNYTFYFPGVMFDKAVCDVWIDPKGRVVSKHAEMEDD